MHCAQSSKKNPRLWLTTIQDWVNDGKPHTGFQTGRLQPDQSRVTSRAGLQKVPPTSHIHPLNKHVPSPMLQTGLQRRHVQPCPSQTRGSDHAECSYTSKSHCHHQNLYEQNACEHQNLLPGSSQDKVATPETLGEHLHCSLPSPPVRGTLTNDTNIINLPIR